MKRKSINYCILIILSAIGMLFISYMSYKDMYREEKNVENSIQRIIAGSETLSAQSEKFMDSVFSGNTGGFISEYSGSLLLRGSINDLKNKSLKITNNTGEIDFGFMTDNYNIPNLLEPGYKGPFTRNVLSVNQSYTISFSGLSKYLDSGDQNLFILMSNFGAYDISREVVSPLEQDISPCDTRQDCVIGAKNIVFLSGDSLIYSGLFAIALPDAVQKNILQDQKTASGERILFSSHSGEKLFSVSTLDKRVLEQEYGVLSEKDLCTKGYIEGVLSKKITTKMLKRKLLYTLDLVFGVYSPDMSPRQSNQYDICFIDDDFIYQIVFVGFKKQEIISIEKSLMFY